MSDAAAPPPNGSAAQDEAPGFCQKCQAAVPMAEITQAPGQPKVHTVGQRGSMAHVCGPVVTVWLYRAVAWVQPKMQPGAMEAYYLQSDRPIGTPQQYVDLEGELADKFQVRDPTTGGAVLGLKPKVTVINLVLVGMQ